MGPILHQTSIIETAAWGKTDQPDFLNQVVVLRPTVLEDRFLTDGLFPDAPSLTERLHDLLNETQLIEELLGRDRKDHWGPRTCDIDIIFVDRIRYEDDRLSLPHPWWRVRDFVGGLIERELPDLQPFGRR